MLLTKNITSTGTKGTHAALTSREEDQQKISMMMIDTYSSPVTPIREIVVNGLEVKQNEPVKIMFESNQTVEKNNIFNNSKVVKSGNITIIDDGPGMSRDFVENFLFRMGASTKDGDENATGGFGIGAKSVFSITNSVTWRTTHEGVTTVAVVSRNGDSFDAIYESFETDEENGTTVIIPVNGEKYTNILDNIHGEYFDFVSPDDLVMTVDGVEKTIGKYHVSDMEDGEVRLIDRYNDDQNTVIILSNSEVPYFYTLSKNPDDISLNAILSHAAQYDHNFSMDYRSISTDKTIVLRTGVAGHVIPNRESLKRSEELSEKIANAITSYYKKEVDEYKKMIDDAKTLSEWRTALNKIKDIVDENKTFVSSVNDPINNIFSNLNHYYNSNKHIHNLEGKSVAIIGSSEYEDIRYKRSLDENDRNINYLLGDNAHKSVKIRAWLDEHDNVFESMNIDTEVALIPNNSIIAWSTPGFVRQNDKQYEFSIMEDLENEISIEGLEVLANRLNLGQLVIDMINEKKLTTPKEVILAVSGAKDIYSPYDLRIKAMEEGGQILSEQRKSGVKKPRQKKEPVHPLTIINIDKDEDDIWFNNPAEFTSWVKDNGINKLIICNAAYQDKSKRKYDYMNDQSPTVNMIEEMFNDGVAFVYAPGRDSYNTHTRIYNIIENYNKKNDDDLNLDLTTLSRGYGRENSIVTHYLAHKFGESRYNSMMQVLGIDSCRCSVTINVDGNNVDDHNGFATIASLSYVASDEVIDDKGTTLFEYLKQEYARHEDYDIDIKKYDEMIEVLQEIYPRDCFVDHINSTDLAEVSKRMMTYETKSKIDQISNLMRYKEGGSTYGYGYDRDKYFMKSIKNIEKFDDFVNSL